MTSFTSRYVRRTPEDNQLKTIANLADTSDKIEIKPTFRYVDKTTGAVTEQDDLKLYYSDEFGNYIEYGSELDKANKKTVQLKDPQFEGSWYREPIFG